MTLNGDLLEFEEVFNLFIEPMLVRLGGFKLVGVEEFVDGLLGPFECEVFDGHFVAVLFDCGYNSVNRGFCVYRILAFWGNEPVLDDDFSVNEELGKYEYVGVCSKGYRTLVAVPE